MGISKCYSLMKCLLIIFNIIFLMVGVGAGVFAAWALYDGRAVESAAARAGLCALCAWAAALAAGAAAALAGAVRHSASLLAAAFALLALSAVAEGAAAWWGVSHVPALRAALRDSLSRAVRLEYGALPSRTAALDAIQHGERLVHPEKAHIGKRLLRNLQTSSLECCGESGVRDWQTSAWSMAAEGAPAAPVDLSVRASPHFYWVPASCCKTRDAATCEAARRVPAGGGGGAALHAAACGPRVLSALGGAARAPLAAAAALAVAHALALLLALALCLRAHPHHAYKA